MLALSSSSDLMSRGSEFTIILIQVPLILTADTVSDLSAIGRQFGPQTHQGIKCDALWPTLAAFQVLLGRYSRQDDITVGIPAVGGGKEVCQLHYKQESRSLQFVLHLACHLPTHRSVIAIFTSFFPTPASITYVGVLRGTSA